jgi:hypothetical protein
VPRIVGFLSTTLRNDFDADLAFVGHSVELTSAPIRSGSSVSGENVREVPNSDIVSRSFDHLVGKLLELGWYIEAHRPGGLEVDH